VYNNASPYLQDGIRSKNGVYQKSTESTELNSQVVPR